MKYIYMLLLLGAVCFMAGGCCAPAFASEADPEDGGMVSAWEADAGVLALTGGFIYEYPDVSSRFVGNYCSGSLLHILKEANDGWYFVEAGEARGYVPGRTLLSGNGAAMIVAEGTGGENDPDAQCFLDPEGGGSVFSAVSGTGDTMSDAADTLSCTGTSGISAGQDLCETACSFVGSLPYVYGGTSLMDGADCSGFTQSVFALYGIFIPRTAEEQGVGGLAVKTLEEAQPGDIVYYASGPHVGIYLGDGMVVHCSGMEYNSPDNPGQGPTVSSVDFMPVTSIRRYLPAEDSLDTFCGIGTYRTDSTPYTAEEMERIQAIVAQEDAGSYDGALAVISAAMNRTESETWSDLGDSAYEQLTADGQFSFSADESWMEEAGGNVPDYVREAVYDCLELGIRNHSYTSFCSTQEMTGEKEAVQIGENWYFGF